MKWLKVLKLKVNTKSWRSRNGTYFFYIIHIVIGVLLMHSSSMSYISHDNNVMIYSLEIVHDHCKHGGCY